MILGDAVDRVGNMAKTINVEVKGQGIMLDGLDHDINDASNRMTTVQEALQKLLKTKDGCQIWTIVILTVILVILSKFPLCSVLNDFRCDDILMYGLLVALVIWT